MNRHMPRTPFSTGLSGSAKETEIRIRNIFSGPKKRPPVLLMALIALLILLCGNLVAFRPWPAEPILVMETQYYDNHHNYLELPMLALPAGEKNEAVEAINAGLTQLGEQYAFINADPGMSRRCVLYPSTTDRYLNLVFFETSNDHSGNEGYGTVRSWVYDKKEGAQVTEEDALALAGTTREALLSDLEEAIANDPEDPRGLYPDTPDPITLMGFRLKADGQPVFYLSAYLDSRVLENGGYYTQWRCPYIWDEGEFSPYACMFSPDFEQYPLVPAEETDKLDPPLWNQWYFAGEEPQGGFVPLASPLSELYNPEVCLYRDGFITPIGPGNWVDSMFSDFEPEIIIQDGLDVYRADDRWDEWVVDGGGDAGGISARRYYDSEADHWSLNRLETGRTDMVTPRGIRVGATREEVLAAYPGLLSDEKNWTWAYPDDYLWYCANENGLGPCLYFFFADDTVYMIQMVDMFN